jgi:hypothetical protein
MGLTYRTTDIQTANIYLDIVSGFFEPPTVRGEDDLVFRAAGRDEMPRRADVRPIRLEGYGRGTGSTELARQQSWYAATSALMDLMDRTLASGPIVVTPPYLGLPSGSKTIDARAVNAVGGPVLSCMTYQRWSFDLECVDSPPEWA